MSDSTDPNAAPVVSIVLRTRNRPTYLEGALEGLAAQTFRDFEALVINDGGCDVADLLATFDGRVPYRYFDHQPGRGRCAAANRGLQEARGEFIAYLDDDDLYYPEHLETLVRAARETDAVVVYTDAHEVIHAAREDGGYEEVSRAVKLSHDFSRARFFLQSYIHLVTFMHRRSCTEAVGGFDEELDVLEDLDLYFRLSQAYDFHHVRQTTAEYRIRDDQSNAITSLTKEFIDTRQMLMVKYTHLVLPEIVRYTEHKDGIVARLMERVESLEQRLAALEGK